MNPKIPQKEDLAKLEAEQKAKAAGADKGKTIPMKP